MIDVGMTSVPCPQCDNQTGAKPVWLLPDHLWFPDEQFPLVRCERCECVYLNPRPDGRALVRHYPEFHYAATEFPPTIPDAFAWRLDQLRRWSEPGRLLDVGCGDGTFLFYASQRGWDVSGLDTNAGAIAMAQQRLGGRVTRSTLLDAQYPGGSFDVVTMFEVLEHLPAIKVHLQEALRLLKPGGWLCVSVPNFESLERYVFGRWWVGLDAPRHLIQFSPESLSSLLSGAGLAIQELRSVNADRIQKSKSRITYAQESVRYLLRAFNLYPQRVPPTPETLYQHQGVPLAPQKRLFRAVEKIFLSPLVRLAGVLDRDNTLWVVGQKP